MHLIRYTHVSSCFLVHTHKAGSFGISGLGLHVSFKVIFFYLGFKIQKTMLVRRFEPSPPDVTELT